MNTRLLCAPVLGITLFTAGCMTHHAAKPTARRNAPEPQPLANQSSPANSSQSDNSLSDSLAGPAAQSDSAPSASGANVAAALAKQTQQYARNLQNSVSKYTNSHNTQPGQESAQESMAGWVDPADFRLGPANSAPLALAPTTAPSQSVAAVKTTEPQLPVANQAIALGDAKKAPEAANTPAAIATNSPESISNSPTAHASTDSFATKITQRAKDFPRDLSAQLDYQLLLFLQDQSVPELTSLTSLPTEDRELMSAVLDGISNFRNTLRQDNNMLLSQKIHPLTDLADRLRAQADLSIPTLTLCKQVDGFGRYEPMDAHLLAGQDNQAIIYCELANFSSQLKDDSKQWQTDVTQEAVLYMDTGEQIWTDKVQQITDQSRNRRHDFFLRTLVTFPHTLTIGRYLLKVTIVDKQTNRMAEASLPIEIVAKQPS